MNEFEKNCTVLFYFEPSHVWSMHAIKTKLENPDPASKAEALTEAIAGIIHDEGYSKLLMTVIRFVVPCSDHRVKKLLQIYLEVVDKCKSDGVLKEEMILVCNALRNDLLSPNEYVRGSTLRLLCKMRYYKILEPLLETILENLNHRHTYVRRNAVMCVYFIVKTFGTEALPSALDSVAGLLETETDLSTKRNAFLMLLHCDLQRALLFVFSVKEYITSLGDIFQLVLLDVLKKSCQQSPQHNDLFLRLIVTISETSPPAVAFEGASTLVTFTNSPTALHAATRVYVKLLLGQSDNNVKLIVLDRLSGLLKANPLILESQTMDLLRALNCQSFGVRKKTIKAVLQLVTNSTIHEVVAFLKRELQKAQEQTLQEIEDHSDYIILLIKTMRACSSKYSQIASTLMPLMLDHITDTKTSIINEVILFLKGVVVQNPTLISTLLETLSDRILDITDSLMLRACFWILGEYNHDPQLTKTVCQSIYEALKPFPFPQTEESNINSRDKASLETITPSVEYVNKTVILSDGSYGVAEISKSTFLKSHPEEAAVSHIRKLILQGDFLMASTLSVFITKSILKASHDTFSRLFLHQMLHFLCCLLIYVHNHPLGGKNCDTSIRVNQCVLAMIDFLKNVKKTNKLHSIFSKYSQLTLMALLKKETERIKVSSIKSEIYEKEENVQTECESLLFFRQIDDRHRNHQELENEVEQEDLQIAIHGNDRTSSDDRLQYQQRIANVKAMSGVADPILVEAFIQVLQFDLIVELLLINRTSDTLQNVKVELATYGKLEVVDSPSPVTLHPHASITLVASLKVQSTERSLIFGYITYDQSHKAERASMILNEIPVDLLIYMRRSYVNENEFRWMWSQFEWENKIPIITQCTSIRKFLEIIFRHTKMTIVGRFGSPELEEETKHASIENVMIAANKDFLKENLHIPIQELNDSTLFFAINLYFKSMFGEDAVANLSIEKNANQTLCGNIRIRSRLQGIALSLGDRILQIQREHN